MNWGMNNLTDKQVVEKLFTVPELQGLYKGSWRTVFVLRSGQRTPRELANIERTIMQCCPPMSPDPRRWKAPGVWYELAWKRCERIARKRRERVLS